MAKNAVDAALAKIDQQIEDLQRARALIVEAGSSEPAPEKPKRTRRKKAGLPLDKGEGI